jgi:hypothetical protein
MAYWSQSWSSPPSYASSQPYSSSSSSTHMMPHYPSYNSPPLNLFGHSAPHSVYGHSLPVSHSPSYGGLHAASHGGGAHSTYSQGWFPMTMGRPSSVAASHSVMPPHVRYLLSDTHSLPSSVSSLPALHGGSPSSPYAIQWPSQRSAPVNSAQPSLPHRVSSSSLYEIQWSPRRYASPLNSVQSLPPRFQTAPVTPRSDMLANVSKRNAPLVYSDSRFDLDGLPSAPPLNLMPPFINVPTAPPPDLIQ